MRTAGVVLALSLGVPLFGCAPSEKAVLNPQQAPAFAANMPEGRWQKEHMARPAAVLFGHATTTRILGLRRAVLEVSCYRGTPRVRVAFDIGLKTGAITVAYRFDDKVQRTGTTRVRGRDRNLIVIDYGVTVATFLTELTTFSKLTVKLSRLPYEFHEADFHWDRGDPALKEVLAACYPGALRKDQKAPAREEADDDAALNDAIKDVLPDGE